MMLLLSTARLTLLLTVMMHKFACGACSPASSHASVGAERTASRAPMRRLLVASSGHAPQVIRSASIRCLLLMMHSTDVCGCLVVATGGDTM